ncbi:MAG: type II secretion system F family protein [Lachnospiraceae bacterium]|nr:type II secretion system F family protein [Lachnospiraceae bacterium]
MAFFVQRKNKRLLEERKKKLLRGFIDGMEGILAALGTGYSLESSFREALRDLEILYGEKEDIILEFKAIIFQLENQVAVEDALYSLAKRSGLEDIKTFTEVLVVAKRTGGDMVEIIRSTNANIREKIQIQREIETLLAEKKLEAGVMNFMPPGIVLYMRIFSPGFLEPLYGNLVGVAVMTFCLFAYFFSIWVSDRIIRIEV